ncbi:alkylphosphocholine resistance protein lem3 [Massospora cicadina]|nr:alkylphosphocholine resistance protein lem3 [Massospora cicadina]
MPEPERKSRKPENTAFKQQRLKSWQPILTPKSISEISIDYTDCYQYDTFHSIEKLFKSSLPSNSTDPMFKGPKYKSEMVAIPNNPNKKQAPLCYIEFPVTVDISPPIYLYYELTNFYQNHRSYVKSVSWPQLRGDIVDQRALNEGCRPLAGKVVEGVFIPYYPCGLIANSIFNGNPFEWLLTVEPRHYLAS